MSYLSDGDQKCIQTVIDTGIVKGVLKLLKLETKV